MPLADLPQTNKQHAVPQNIMDVEFKLIGDLTMRQFAYLIICGGIAYFASVIVVGLPKWPVIIFFTLLGLGLAFVPIQERGLDEWIANFFRAIYMPTQRLWQKEATIPSAFLYENLAVVRQELITLAPTSSRRKLEEYLDYQSKNEKEDPLDIPEKEYARKVREAFADVRQSASVGVTLEEPEISLVDEVYAPQQPQLNIPEEPVVSPESENTPSAEQMPTSTPSNVAPVPTEVAPVTTTTPVPTAAPQTTAPVATPMVVKTIPPQQPKQVKQPQPQIRQQRPQQQPQRKAPNLNLRPMTPDMHSGRRFVNLVPISGELVLPIRGERVLQTSEQIDIEDDIQEKAEKLQLLLSQIRTNNMPKEHMEERKQDVARTTHLEEVTSAAPKEKSAQEVDNQAADLANLLKSENDRLAKEINNLQTSKQTTTDQTEAQKKEESIRRLEAERRRTQADYEVLQKQLLDLQTKLNEKSGSSNETDTSTKPVYARIQPLTSKPNVVSGIVKLADGTLVEAVLLIIKNSQGEAVRAIKTNSLGQFILSTPLTNGIYTLEVSSPNNKAVSFDIISVEVKGEVIPPIEVIGR